jgi:hypothetical protein
MKKLLRLKWLNNNNNNNDDDDDDDDEIIWAQKKSNQYLSKHSFSVGQNTLIYPDMQHGSS